MAIKFYISFNFICFNNYSIHIQLRPYQTTIAHFAYSTALLLNISNFTYKTILLFLQHGESTHNIVGRIGGDSDLSPRGRQYAKALANYIDQQQIPGLRVWTSWMKRAIQTVKDVKAPQERWKALNEIDAVSCYIIY